MTGGPGWRRRAGAGAIGLLLIRPGVMGQGAGGQDIGHLTAEVARLSELAKERGSSPEERETAEGATIEARARLIAAGERVGDGRAAGWRTEQGAAVLRRLGRDGSDTSVLLGLPTPAQREAVRAGAAQAEGWLAGVPRGQAEAERPGVAMLRGRAACLTAAMAEGTAEHGRLVEIARGAFDREETGDAAIDAAGQVGLGIALLLGGGEEAAALARAEFEQVLSGANTDQSPVPPGWIVAEAWFGVVNSARRGAEVTASVERLRRARAGPPFVVNGRADPLLAVLAAEAIARACVEAHRRDGDAALLATGFGEMLAIIGRDDLGLDPESRRVLVYDKIAPAVGPGTPFDLLPAEVAFARAVVVGREPEGQAEAVGLLLNIASRSEAGGLRAEALWEFAVIMTRGEEAEARWRAVQALERLARDFPASARAGEAMAAAVALGRDLVRTEAPGGMARPAHQVYGGVLRTATTMYAARPEADAWRCERARWILRERAGDEQESGPAGARLALELLGRVPAASPVSDEAAELHAEAATRVFEDGWARIVEARRRGDGAAAAGIARDELLPVARRAVAWAEGWAGAAVEQYRLELADALVESGERGATAFYKSSLGARGGLRGEATRVRLGLGRAQLIEGDRAGAFATLYGLAAALEREGDRGEAFWHAWAAILEILSGENRDRSRTAVIRAHVARLVTIDAGLGGEPWAGRIRRVLEK